MEEAYLDWWKTIKNPRLSEPGISFMGRLEGEALRTRSNLGIAEE